MKKVSFFLIFTISSIIFLFSTNFENPVIFCENPIYNVGKVNSKLKEITHTFTLINKGNSPLHIEKVINTCSCTNHILSKKVLDPGESVEITITVNIEDKFGQFKDGIFIKSNDPKNPDYSLMIEGYVTVDYLIDPLGIDLGKFLQSQYKDQNEIINVKIFSEKIKGIKEIKLDNPYLTYKVNYDKKNRLYSILIFFNKKPPLGYKEGNITISFKSENPVEKNISYFYEVVPQIKVKPGGVSLSILKENNPHIFIFYIYYNRPFKILDVSLPDGFSYQLEKIRNKKNLCVYRFKLILEDENLSPDWKKENIVLRTSLEKNPFVTIEILN